MAASQMVPMIAPDGSIGDVPLARMQDAIHAGFQVGVAVKSPDGQSGVIPAHRYQDALAKGFKIDNSANESQPQKEGGLAAFGNDLKGLLTPQAQNPYPGMGTDQKVAAAQQAVAQDNARKAAGYGAGYRALAPVAQAVGVNVPGMEQAAAQGDPNAILGHAAAAATPYAVGAAAHAVDPAIEAVQRRMAAEAPELYKSALKPTTVPSKQAQVAKGIQTGLNYEIPVSEAGVEKLSALIDETNRAIKDAIDSKPGQTVNKYKIAARLSDTADRFSQQVAPTTDLETISKIGNDFLDTKPGEIPASDAQAMKIGTYQQVKRNYGTLSLASVEAQKALARGAKEELANAFPELNELNAKDSAFYGLDPLLQRAVARISNHQVIGIGTPAAGMAAKAATGSGAAAAVAGMLKAVVDNPSVKSRLAIMLNNASKGKITLPQAMTRVAAYSAALGKAVASGSEQPADDQASQ